MSFEQRYTTVAFIYSTKPIFRTTVASDSIILTMMCEVGVQQQHGPIKKQGYF